VAGLLFCAVRCVSAYDDWVIWEGEMLYYVAAFGRCVWHGGMVCRPGSMCGMGAVYREGGRIVPTTDVYARGVILKTGCLSAIFSKTPICCAMSGRLGVAFGIAERLAGQHRCTSRGVSQGKRTHRPYDGRYARGVILKTGCLSAIASKTSICCAMSGRLGVAFGMAEWCADQDRCGCRGVSQGKRTHRPYDGRYARGVILKTGCLPAIASNSLMGALGETPNSRWVAQAFSRR
jgi:hypothetical protein